MGASFMRYAGLLFKKRIVQANPTQPPVFSSVSSFPMKSIEYDAIKNEIAAVTVYQHDRAEVRFYL